MPTPWFYPSTYNFQQIDDTDVAWIGNFGLVRSEDKVGVSSGLLQSRNNDLAGGHITNKTQLVQLSNWNFTELLTNIKGIQLHISCNKQGRILEDTLNFTDTSGQTSDNKVSWSGQSLEYFHADYDNEAYYGGPTDNWGLNLSTLVLDANFTLNLRYQANFFTPHKSCIIIDTIRLRFY
jgi:hypothetical protein